MSQQAPLYGLLAEFERPEDLAAAVRTIRAQGYRRLDAFTPYPVSEVTEALGARRTAVPWLTFLGGLSGCALGYWLQYWVSVIDYPLNVGGRPLHSWPSFVIVTFELTVLFAGITAVLSMLALNRLPRPSHPLFTVERFRRASQDRFFLCVEAADPRFHEPLTRRLLSGLNPVEVLDVHMDE
jgi:hypothetical protein